MSSLYTSPKSSPTLDPWTPLTSPGTGRKLRNRRMRHRTLTDTRVILYDRTVLKKERDDPKDAILYSYPETMNDTELCNLVGQLMGMVELFSKHLSSPPKFIYLKFGMYVFKHVDKKYCLVLGSTNHQNGSALLQQLELLYQVFYLLQGNIKNVKTSIEHSTTIEFLNSLKTIFDSYLPLCFHYNSVLEHSLETVPSFSIPKNESQIFMEVVTLLETCQRRPGVLGGCVLFKNKMVFSQLPQTLTKVLTAIYADLLNLQCETVDLGSIPEGIRLTKVYLSYDEYNDLYDTLHIPNTQHYSHSNFSRSNSEASSKQLSKKQQASGESKESDELNSGTKSESETESELSLKGIEKCESKQKSAEMTLAERTKARAAYFTLISEATTTEDFNQVVASTKNFKFLRTASICLDVGETWPVVSVPGTNQDDTPDTSEKDSPTHEGMFSKQHLSSSSCNSEELKSEKMVIDFKNKPENQIKEASTDSESSQDLEKTEASPSKKTAVETCPLTDEQQLYKTMMNDLSKRSRRNSIKPPFNPNPSLPECSTNVEEQNSLILYVQTNSESSTILLMEPWACKMEAIHTLWKFILPKLGILDYHFKKIDQNPRLDCARKCVMKSVVLDNLQKQLTGYERQKHPLVDAELEKMLLDTHETFKCYPTAMDITLGSHCACSYGHRNPGMEVFYQKSFEHSLAFSPQASNMVIIMETLARNHLKDDKDLVLV